MRKRVILLTVLLLVPAVCMLGFVPWPECFPCEDNGCHVNWWTEFLCNMLGLT